MLEIANCNTNRVTHGHGRRGKTKRADKAKKRRLVFPQAMAKALFARRRKPLRFRAIHEYRIELNQERALLTGAHNPRNEVSTGDLENRILHENGYRCDWDSEAGKLLREHLRRASLQLLDIRRARFDGDFSDHITDSLFEKKAVGQIDRLGVEAVSLGKAIEEYRQVVIANGEQAEHQAKTKDRYLRELYHIEHFFGPNRALNSIKATECDHFRNTFSRA